MNDQLLPWPSLQNSLEKMIEFKPVEDPEPIRRWRTASAPISPSNINSQPFVRRIGGNQLHAVSESDSEYKQLRKSNPDGVQSPRWAGILSPGPFLDIHLWRNACFKGWDYVYGSSSPA